MTQYVIWRRRLLDPERLDLREAGHPADGLAHVPSLVGINHLTQKHFIELSFPKNNEGLGQKQSNQRVVWSNHLPDESTPANVILQISADFHLELGPAIFKCICAELQKNTTDSEKNNKMFYV